MNACTVFDSGHGWIGLAMRDGRLVRSTLPKPSREEAVDALDAGLDDGCVEDRSAFGDLPDKLRRYFAGERVYFDDVEIDVSAQPPFLAAVQRAARKIPYGDVATYRDLARMAGNAKAARAAGSAMARNELPIIVPCHRVVASNGLGGFALGMEWKRQLLRLEGMDLR
jgi:methylated-DNA-[protein]-cysteine S-methyltransferase